LFRQIRQVAVFPKVGHVRHASPTTLRNRCHKSKVN
jgi:hypothetical protein